MPGIEEAVVSGAGGMETETVTVATLVASGLVSVATAVGAA